MISGAEACFGGTPGGAKLPEDDGEFKATAPEDGLAAVLRRRQTSLTPLNLESWNRFIAAAQEVSVR